MKQSAGILLYRRSHIGVEFLLVHPGGPFWKNKDVGCWSIPKGEFTDGEIALDAARREFHEETGFSVTGQFIALQPLKMKSSKIIYAWACEQDIDPKLFVSNTFELEWPPKTGTIQTFPEIDKAEWFSSEQALIKIHESQANFIKETIMILQN